MSVDSLSVAECHVGMGVRQASPRVDDDAMATLAVGGATLIALRTALHPASLPAIVFAGAVGGAVYATTYLMLSASAPERSVLLRAATGLRRTTAAAARARFGG